MLSRVLSTAEEWGPFSLYVRGEYNMLRPAPVTRERWPDTLAINDEIPNECRIGRDASGPACGTGPVSSNRGYASFHLLGHELSGGKIDSWLGPGYGSAMAWPNNAENVYAFHLNRSNR